MPKEYINNRYYGQHARQASSDGEDSLVALDDSAVKVGWTKDHQHVEIAIVRDRDRADGTSADSDPNCWHSQFDRDGLNRLIRTLRKARDDAFGPDA